MEFFCPAVPSVAMNMELSKQKKEWVQRKLEREVSVWDHCYGRGRKEIRRKLRLPERDVERSRTCLLTNFKRGTHPASFTMDEIREEAKGVFKHVRLAGVRR